MTRDQYNTFIETVWHYDWMYDTSQAQMALNEVIECQNNQCHEDRFSLKIIRKLPRRRTKKDLTTVE